MKIIARLLLLVAVDAVGAAAIAPVSVRPRSRISFGAGATGSSGARFVATRSHHGLHPKSPPPPEKSKMDWRWIWGQDGTGKEGNPIERMLNKAAEAVKSQQTFKSGWAVSDDQQAQIQDAIASYSTTDVVDKATNVKATKKETQSVESATPSALASKKEPSFIVFTPPPSSMAEIDKTPKVAVTAQVNQQNDVARRGRSIGGAFGWPTGRRAAMEGKPEYEVTGVKHELAAALATRVVTPLFVALGCRALANGNSVTGGLFVAAAGASLMMRMAEAATKSYHKAHRVISPVMAALLLAVRHPRVAGLLAGGDKVVFASRPLAIAMNLLLLGSGIDSVRQWSYLVTGA